MVNLFSLINQLQQKAAEDVKTEVANNVKECFAKEGIDIPYPTRVTLSKNLD